MNDTRGAIAPAAPQSWAAPGGSVASPATAVTGQAPPSAAGGADQQPQIEFNFGLPGQSDFFEGIFKGSALSIYEDEEA